MHTSRRRAGAAAVAVAVVLYGALPLNGPGSAARAQTKPRPILIAHASPTTGRFAQHSEADRRGVEMALDEYNARGGVLGRELVLVAQNSTLDPKRAAEITEELITRNRVGFIVGAISSGVAASMSAVAQKYGVIFINTNSSAPSESVENAHRTKFVFDGNGANFNHALLRHALAERKSKRVLLLMEDNAAGRSQSDAIRPLVAEYGGSVVGEVLSPENLVDPGAVLAKVAASGADVVNVVISGDNQIKLFGQIEPQVLQHQSWLIGEVDWEELYPAPGTPRPLFGTTWAWNLDTPGTAEFVARYRQRYGRTKLDYPGDVTHASYLATKALLDSIERAGTTDNHAVIQQLEKYRASARERMQHTDAFMDPVSHHLQQSVYIARWQPNAEHPERGIEIVRHIPPQQVRYEQERTTRLEPLADTPHYAP